MSESDWDEFSECYEAFIDWPKRLAHEAPFYRRVFADCDAADVLDAACGTGHHAAMFHSWGLRVEGADINPAMLERARQAFGEPGGLQWICRGFAEPVRPAGRFQAAICVGNSLALAADCGVVQTALRQLVAALQPGGVLVLHVLNVWRLPDGPCVWQKGVRTTLRQGPSVVLKGVHRQGAGGYVDLVVVQLADPLTFRSTSVPFLGLEAMQLQEWVQAAGATTQALYGGYHGEPYERETSTDLIVVAGKPQTP
ncbi:MAG: class I SAM-dependent methyltransferase [Pirellulaceae bacterium]|jgi:SAM-dependent methyltransferase|nr:class I SAM-dependent methyltransferase [Pirellulaceae bacterium]